MTGKRINEIGNRYGSLVVVKEGEPRRCDGVVKELRWICDCDCGRESPKSIVGSVLRKGDRLYCTFCSREKVRRRTLSKPSVERRMKRLKEGRFVTNLKIKYGLTVDDFTAMIEEQKNSCAICGFEFKTKDGLYGGYKERWSKPCVDHCHDSGNIRGLLCFTCNIGLGHFKDSPKILQSAIDYLA